MNPLASEPRLRISIAQFMVLIVMSTLCLVPLMAALKSGQGTFILGAVALDLIVIPLFETLMVAAYLRSSFHREWYLRAIWLTPALRRGILDGLDSDSPVPESLFALSHGTERAILSCPAEIFS